MSNPVMAPILDPSIAKDMAEREKALEQYGLDLAEIQKLALALKGMNGPFSNALQVVNQILLLVTDSSGDKIKGLSAVDDIETDMRNGLSKNQNEFNGIGSTNPTDPNKQAQGMIDGINGLEALIQYYKSLGSASPVSGSTLDSMQTALNNITSQFTSGTPPHSDWNNAAAMVTDIQNWVKSSGGGSGTYAPQIQAVLNGFQTLNQSVSALSTATNTDLQFNGEQFKQFLGIAQSGFQALLKLTAAFINAKSQ